MSTQISSKLYLALVASVGLMAENAYALYPETWHVCNKTAEKLNIETLHRHNVRIRIPGSYDDYNTNKFTLDALKCADISTKYDTKPNDQEVSAFRLVVTKAGDTSDVLGVELKSDPSNLSNYSKDATTWTPMYFGARDGWTFLANVEGVHDCTNSKDRFCDSLGRKGTIDVQNFNGGKFRIYPAHYNKTQNLDIVWFKDPKNYNEIDKAILADISDGFDNSNFQSALKNAIGGGPFHFGELGKNSARVVRNEDGSYLTGSKGEPAANLGAYNGIKLCKVYSPLYLADGTTEFNPDPNYKLTNDFQETFGPVELVNEDPKRTIKLRSDGKTTTFTEINTTTLTHGWKVGAEVTTKGTANLIFKKAEVSLKASVEYNGSHATQVSKSVMYSYNIPNQEADVPPRTKYIYTGYYTKAKAKGEYRLDYVLTSPTVYADIATAANNFDCAHPTHKRAIIDVSGFAQYLPEKSKLKSLDYNPVTKHVAIYGKGYYEATAATNTSTTSVKVVNLDTGKTVDEHNLSEQPATIK